MGDEQQPGTGQRGPGRLLRLLWRPVMLLALLVALAVAARRWELADRLESLRQWIGGLGPAAPLGFVLVRAGAAVALVPGSGITLTGSVLFDPFVAVACVSVGKTLGACVAFVISRYFARRSVERWLAGTTHLEALDELVRERGALVVALMRLAPLVPFNVQNYGFGLTSVRFGTYVLWSWLGMLPAAVFVVSAAGVVEDTLGTSQVPWVRVAVMMASLAAMVGLAVYALLKLLTPSFSSDSLDGRIVYV
ncbi:MAG: TVP38/TMEM64 family protein [Candidatus Brocadiia bacterium]